VLLGQTSDEGEKAHYYINLGYVKDGQGDYEKALWYHEKGFEISKKTLPPNHPLYGLFGKANVYMFVIENVLSKNIIGYGCCSSSVETELLFNSSFVDFVRVFFFNVNITKIIFVNFFHLQISFLVYHCPISINV
jgi:hypothetical protein